MKKVGIVGVGRMGSIYLKCLLEMEQNFEICVYDKDSEKLNTINNAGIKVFFEEKEFMDYVDCLIIASNPECHMYFVNLGVAMKKDMIVEKPMVVNLNEYNEIKQYINSGNCIIVDHVEEYRKAFQLFKSKINNLKEIYIYRVNKSICRSSFDNVVLDLLPHDIGIALSIAGNSKFEVISVNCEYNKENVVKKIEVDLLFENGVKCRILDAKEEEKNERYCIAHSGEEIIKCDFQNDSVVEVYGEQKLVTKFENDNPIKSLLRRFSDCVDNDFDDIGAFSHALEAARGYIYINGMITKEAEKCV